MYADNEGSRPRQPLSNERLQTGLLGNVHPVPAIGLKLCDLSISVRTGCTSIEKSQLNLKKRKMTGLNIGLLLQNYLPTKLDFWIFLRVHVEIGHSSVRFFASTSVSVISPLMGLLIVPLIGISTPAGLPTGAGAWKCAMVAGPVRPE